MPAFAAWPDVAQLIAKDWEKVGVKTIVQLRERALHFKMRDANELQVEMWNEDTTAFPFTGNAKVDVRNNPILTTGPLYKQWYQTKGKEGVEPPAPIKKIVELVDTARTVGPDGQVKAAQEIFRIWADQRVRDRDRGPHADGPGRGRRQHQASQRAHHARQRLAAPEPGQRAPGAVLLHEVAARSPRPVPPPPGGGPGRGPGRPRA